MLGSLGIAEICQLLITDFHCVLDLSGSNPWKADVDGFIELGKPKIPNMNGHNRFKFIAILNIKLSTYSTTLFWIYE
jgi:hypothetical protein